jgi:hypothetical protein
MKNGAMPEMSGLVMGVSTPVFPNFHDGLPESEHEKVSRREEVDDSLIVDL